jgi:NhaP-type Na+/H+ or K+/H+ antiporter
VQGLLARLGGGVLIGVTVGWLLSEGLRRLTPSQAVGLRLQLTLGALFLMFGIAEWLLPESGLPASVAAGVVVGRRSTEEAGQLDELIRELASLAITMLFPLLAADVSWAELSPLGWGGVSCVLLLMFVVRPVAVGVATVGLPLVWRQKLFMAWLAPRGIVTAAVASLFAIRLEQAGILGAGRLQGLVFLTILMTVGIQGLTAQPLARVLGLIAESPEDSESSASVSSEAATQALPIVPESGQ